MITMPDQVLLLVQGAATLLAMLSLICRAGRMTAATPLSVRMQHAVLFGGLAFSLVLPALAGKTALALGVMAWLAIAAPRWRYGAPGDLLQPEQATTGDDWQA